MNRVVYEGLEKGDFMINNVTTLLDIKYAIQALTRYYGLNQIIKMAEMEMAILRLKFTK